MTVALEQRAHDAVGTDSVDHVRSELLAARVVDRNRLFDDERPATRRQRRAVVGSRRRVCCDNATRDFIDGALMK